jgi:hypothetical protein
MMLPDRVTMGNTRDIYNPDIRDIFCHDNRFVSDFDIVVIIGIIIAHTVEFHCSKSQGNTNIVLDIQGG